MFAPSDQVALLPLVTGVSPFKMVTVASSSVGVAVMVLVALVVSAVYSVTLEANSGVRVSDPIDSPDKVASKGLLLPDGTRSSI